MIGEHKLVCWGNCLRGTDAMNGVYTLILILIPCISIHIFASGRIWREGYEVAVVFYVFLQVGAAVLLISLILSEPGILPRLTDPKKRRDDFIGWPLIHF